MSGIYIPAITDAPKETLVRGRWAFAIDGNEYYEIHSFFLFSGGLVCNNVFSFSFSFSYSFLFLYVSMISLCSCFLYVFLISHFIAVCIFFLYPTQPQHRHTLFPSFLRRGLYSIVSTFFLQFMERSGLPFFFVCVFLVILHACDSFVFFDKPPTIEKKRRKRRKKGPYN